MANFTLVSGAFYTYLSDWLEAGAMAALAAAGHSSNIIRVPGALEIPAAIKFLSNDANNAGFVALGCVIRGETTHYDLVANLSAEGLQKLALEQEIVIGNGILTVENRRQAEARANPGRTNKGGEAALAALALYDIKQRTAAA